MRLFPDLNNEPLPRLPLFESLFDNMDNYPDLLGSIQLYTFYSS